jgi:cell division protein ZipA
MDKELLRIAIIGTGLIIMIVMIVSAYLKDKQAQEDDDDYYDDDEEFEDDDDVDDKEDAVKKPSIMQMLNNAYLQKVQKHQKSPSHVEVDEDDEEDEFEPDVEHHEQREESHRPASAPAIIQFSVITKGKDDFNVADVFHVLEGLELEYGSMKIFERVDKNRFVRFGVASMVEPGTFPEENLEEHYCPGVVFFMQVDDLANPKEVFDDYVDTAVAFAHEMDGVVLDHRRQPLTDAMVNAIRDNL